MRGHAYIAFECMATVLAIEFSFMFAALNVLLLVMLTFRLLSLLSTG